MFYAIWKINCKILFFISQNESEDIRTWTWDDYQRLEIPVTIYGAGQCLLIDRYTT